MHVSEWAPNVALGFFLTLILVKLLVKLAWRIGLVDRPGQRKHHDRAIPLVGGVAMAIAFLSSVWILEGSLQHFYSLFVVMVLLCAVGVGDDLWDLSTTSRFVAQGVAAVLMVSTDVSLGELGDLNGAGNVALHELSLPFTIFCVIGVTNALNMIDGLDGLAGGVAFIAIVWLVSMSVFTLGSDGVQEGVMLMLLAVIAGFLFFNLRHPWRQRASIFMGDAGSMVLGVALAWFMVDLSQGEGRKFSPIIAVWILGLPLIDTVTVMLRRGLSGRSPFCGDRQHLHHILLKCGYSDTVAVWILLLVSALLGAVGVAGWYLEIPEYLLFYGFLTLFTLYFFGSSTVVWGLGKRTARRERIPQIGEGSR